ncbi:putative Cysteine-rich RLK (RECEPTOR-like protein kinase) 8 [Hibiscus syriacus]|uniref:Cysteine-rich RLK (RECEPTOR-like protein kinase) 8 n=1 Tax=Hibiscus syriacus TaxID=106335 RepID=A0A6A2XUV0_HIBSY|nr:vinorine synthase-like [Hibiscus syriacus]KAE8679298.1 putative Cysteine-rich RLK (RECEPTOR-like protein kinase) 8 [Hibiscus syriacus]
MEVCITSKEMVKPSSMQVYNRKPFSLSLLDQFVPAHYIPLIFFYSKPSDSRFNTTAQILVGLKESLSEALNHFYPLSGRTIDNLRIGSFDKGVPYVEARVKGCLADCIAQTELELFNQLLPCQCYCSVLPSASPQIAIQINIFDCGGIAIAFCGSHKIIDAATASAFIKSWAAFNRGFDGKISNPNMLDAGSRLFPPLDPVPPKYASLIERLWFEEGWYTTRRFVFDDQAIATLKLRVKSKRLEHPTRTATLAAFLWKHAMLASRAASGRSKPSYLIQPVNLRTRMKPGLPNHAIGNLNCLTVSKYNSVDRDIELHELAYLAREAIEVLNDQIPLLQSGGMLKFQTDQFNDVEDVHSKDDVDFFDCVSWLNTLDKNEVDFGWGDLTSLSMGCPETRYNAFVSSFILNETEKSKGVEAVVTLDAKTVDILERDSEFLTFASAK